MLPDAPFKRDGTPQVFDQKSGSDLRPSMDRLNFILKPLALEFVIYIYNFLFIYYILFIFPLKFAVLHFFYLST